MMTWIIIAIIFFIAAYAIWEIFRPVYFSKPGGAYSVGTLGMEITDASRIEDALNGENKHRRLILQFWYPATKKPGLKRRSIIPTPTNLTAM